jgi:hypothetical protein
MTQLDNQLERDLGIKLQLQLDIGVLDYDCPVYRKLEYLFSNTKLQLFQNLYTEEL